MIKRLQELCLQRGTTYEAVLSPSRNYKLMAIRQDLYLVFREEFPDKSLPQLGALFDRDHSTIYYGINKAKARREAKALQG